VYRTITLSGEHTHRDVGAILAALSEQIKWDPKPPPTTTMSITDIQVQLQMIQAELKKIRKKASSIQSDMLQERAAAESLAGKMRMLPKYYDISKELK
jgi:glyceraldehyde-3-phosphate dehydrogenase/erythrose-4-phosphate dehydrogenase